MRYLTDENGTVWTVEQWLIICAAVQILAHEEARIRDETGRPWPS